MLFSLLSIRLPIQKEFAGSLVNFSSRHIRFLQRVLLTLIFTLTTICILPELESEFHRIANSDSGVAAAQSHVPILRVEVDLQPIEVQVKDAKGNDVSGLAAKDFTVLENGQRQKISFFDAGSGPVSIAILVDSSSSMNSAGRLGSPQAIAAQFMRTARPEDAISIMEFSDEMGSFQRLTSKELQNPSDATLASVPSRGSAVYDAIATALCHLRASKNLRQAVIVITDGVDEYSRISLEQLIGLVRTSHAQLFMIGLQSRSNLNFQRHAEPRLTVISGQDIDNPVIVFDHLMKESGAQSFIPRSNRGLNEALEAVSNMLQSEYTLAYYPQKNGNQLRKIEVKVDRRGVRVLARHFVDSQRDASQFVHFDEATCTVSPKFHPYPYEADVTNGPSGETYRENFSNPHSGWPVHEDSHYVSGGYELSSPEFQIGKAYDAMRALGSDAVTLSSATPSTVASPAAFRQNIVAAYGPWWINFRASVTVKTDANSAAGLVFRMNELGYYALLISDSGKDISAELVKVQGNGHTQLTIIPWISVVPASLSETEISIEAIEDHISIYVEDQKVKSLVDESFAQGLVGFVISGPGRATFRNLVVEQK